MYNQTAEIVKKADRIVKSCGTRDPHRIAKELGINVRYADFKRQRGAYKVIMRNRYVFLNPNLHPVMESIVLWHEIGHDQFHRN